MPLFSSLPKVGAKLALSEVQKQQMNGFSSINLLHPDSEEYARNSYIASDAVHFIIKGSFWIVVNVLRQPD